MTGSYGLLALIVAAADAGTAVPADATQPPAAEADRRVLPAHRADVEVVRNGTTRHGRLIVTGDGEAHLEQLGGEAQRWASAVIRRAASPSRGWNDRIDPVRIVWGRLGTSTGWVEIHTPDASLRVSQHELLSTR